jgi:hypothetical protein
LYYQKLASWQHAKICTTNLWGRLLTCGGLSIRLLASPTKPRERPRRPGAASLLQCSHNPVEIGSDSAALHPRDARPFTANRFYSAGDDNHEELLQFGVVREFDMPPWLNRCPAFKNSQLSTALCGSAIIVGIEINSSCSRGRNAARTAPSTLDLADRPDIEGRTPALPNPANAARRATSYFSSSAFALP